MKSLFIFRRDFRLIDNLGFIECYNNSDEVIPIFIFTPEQIENNEYFSSNSLQFLLESLEELNKEIKIHYYYGNNITILKSILENYKYNSIYFNMDYTPYARKRDDEINLFCNENKLKCIIVEDYLLSPISTYLKIDGTPYQKYTPFKNNAKKIKINDPSILKFNYKKCGDISKKTSIFNIKDLPDTYNPNTIIKGGRNNALDILKNLKHFKNYDKVRNNLITPTTHLSAYIKYGCISIR